ncbi:F-box/FBD/LRR-repeat protein At1g13570-like [Vicia villosa]|uniref:F-box/FBD/LRR-repeat protein At1g13570-like n=1 Tax=Vicia villosa TaxID=3911 RepID=UPI00273A9FD2|nr:F-box/FBD/LRR-repeat protein At1g13570-like [Vicia villosa]XP_058724959.1 F-box/FBD/LRR-repeat protein At1g13570-like [Vicia villosa]
MTTRRKVIDAESDIISDLPGHIIDHILSHLPIREAVRTSVLSYKWRNKWYTLPNLVFDKQFVPATIDSKDLLVIDSKFLKIVDHVLLLHSGPINVFKLCECDVNRGNVVGDIDRWILYLTGRSIKELVLEVWLEEKPYKIPFCLFSCQSLHHLKLRWSWFKPPKMFKGFRNLKSLDLNMVTVAQDDFANLISGCPLLEKLILTEVDGLTQINIHAPNLKFFEIVGEFEGISFDNTFQLATVFADSWVDFNFENNQSTLHGRSSNFLKFFDHLPHIQSLMIHGYFLKNLAAGISPGKLPTPCIDLSYLSLSVNFDNLEEILAALCLLGSSPNLQKLEIHARFEVETLPLAFETYCWEDTFSRPATPFQVRHVTLDNISGCKSELDFIQFLLLYSPVLEKMTVKPLPTLRLELMTELIRFKRASGEAEVIYVIEDLSY